MKSSFAMHSLATAALVAALTVGVQAQEARPANTAEATPADIDRLITELDSDVFDARQAATRRLIELGQKAIGPVAKAAEGASLEVTTRAIEILKAGHQADDAATKQAATEALKKLSDSPNAAAARRAAAAIAPPTPAQPAPNAFGGIQIQGIQIQALPGRVMKVQARQQNGEKTVEVEKDGKKIKIVENAKDGIAITVTETVDGKEKTQTYKAKNEEELKKNHPEGHKLYQEFGGNGNNGQFQIQIGALPAILPQGVPVPVLPQAIPAQRIKHPALERIDAAKKEIETSLEALKKLNGEQGEAVKAAIEQLETARKQLDEARQRLGG